MRISYVLLLSSVFALTASADTIFLNFEGLNDEQSILNFYNGGLTGDGVGPGPSDGVVFSANALSLVSAADGGSGDFAENPSGDTILFFDSGGAATMDVAAGFTTGFSFFYSAASDPGSINVWSGLDDTGTLLATLTLPTTPVAGDPGCNGIGFCPFVPIGVSFAGTAMSVDFGGSVNEIGFDDVTLGSATADAVPEPATVGLLGLGLASIVTVANRRRKLR